LLARAVVFGSITVSLLKALRMQIGIVGLGRMGGNMARRIAVFTS
jgi:lactate dehydrogenase-like 2-hydroxyacid dehydrogenase